MLFLHAAPMGPTAVAAIFIILVCAGASFFFALAETALFSLGKWQVRQLAEAAGGGRAGATLARLLANPQDLLATMVLGNTFASAAMLAVAYWMVLQGTWPLWQTTVVLLALILFGCEVLPKTLAVRKPEQWSLRVAGLLLFLERFGLPLRGAAQKINTTIIKAAARQPVRPTPVLTDEEYQELLDLGLQQGSLGQSERDMILQVISLDRRTAKEVMKPRSQMACISDDLSIEEMIAAAQFHKHRRLPIYDETPDTIVGILNTRALLLDPQIDLADAIEFPSFVPETMNLLQLLKSLQRQQRGMAMVLDEFG
ncbi:MAG TPA: CNNM domain-containing protein, partial [Verrucomicrobiae bacterium]|nr:CNNM domain-containing protein [Verrucomicrobiae bacterium]